MKHFMLIFALMAAVAASGQPKAFFPFTKYDFGAFDEESGKVTCEFPIVNVGTEPLAITSARATCGCTSPRYQAEPIAPGDTAYISVAFDPQGRPGRFSKQIYVETNTVPRKTRLDIAGVVIGAGATVSRRYPVDFGPLKLAHNGMMVGEVVKGRLKTVYFEGYNQSADSLKIKVVRKPAYVDIVVAPEVTPPGEQATLIAYVNSAKCPLYGLVEDSVSISPVGGEVYSLPMTVIVNEDFSKLDPDKMAKAPIAVPETETVDFGLVDRAGEPVSRSFTLSNAGKNNLEIRRIYSADPGVTAKAKAMTVKKGKKTDIEVTVDPSVQTGGLLNSRLVVITNDPLHPSYTIRLVGQWK